MFNFLDFETIGACNRTCPTCLRNSYPDRQKIQSWFDENLLDEDLIYKAIEQALELGFRGGVCLSHYNEPLMDHRLPNIVRRVRSYNELEIVYLHTNGDFLTEEKASELDGVLDRIIVTLYMGEPAKSQRCEWIKGLFQKTELYLLTDSDHIPTHFSPAFNVARMAEIARRMTCIEPDMRLIINHRRQYLLCCEDIVSHFNLGVFPDTGIEEYWLGKNRPIAKLLKQDNGRVWHHYCFSCPRGAPWK